MPSYYETVPICRAAIDVTLRVDAVAYLFERLLARECDREESK